MLYSKLQESAFLSLVHGSEMDPSGQARPLSSNTGMAVIYFSSFSETVTTAVGTVGSCERQLELCTTLSLIPPCAGPSSYLESNN